MGPALVRPGAGAARLSTTASLWSHREHRSISSRGSSTPPKAPTGEGRGSGENLGGGLGGSRKRRGDATERGGVMRRRQEPGLERGWGQVHPAVQHGVKERGVGGGRLGSGVVEVADRRAAAEENREQVPGGLQVVRDAGRGQG